MAYLTKDIWIIFGKTAFFFNATQAYSAYSHKRKNIPVNYKKRADIATLGIKDFYVHIKNYQLEDYFINQEQLNVIHLRRDNILKRLVSAMLMKKVGVVSTEENTSKSIQAEIDVEKLIKNLARDVDSNNSELEFVKKLQQHHPVYQVSYEEYFKDDEPLNTHNRQILEFIGVEPIYKKSNHKKIISNDLKEVIGNYDDLEKSIKLTPY